MSKVVRLLIVCGAVLFLAVACQKSSEPKNDDNQATLIASGTIGSDGGDVGNGNIRVSVPPGAFATSTELKLYSLKTENIFAEYAAADEFKISGLPAEFTLPVRIAVKHNGQLSATSYVAIGSTNPVAISDTPETVYVLIEAVDSSGFLIADLAATNSASKNMPFPRGRVLSATAEGDCEVTAVTNFDPPLTTSRNHFIVHMPADLDAQVKKFLPKDLESWLDTISGCGFNLNLITWPMEVFIAPLKSIDNNRCGVFLPYKGRYYLLLSLDKLKDPVDNYVNVTAAAGRELFHAMLSRYDPSYFMPGTMQPNLDRYWFHIAASLWAESRFRMNSDYRPPPFFGNDYLYRGERGRAPFRGVQAGATGNLYAVYEHGCGMAGMMKYLIEHYGRGILLPTYQEISALGINPVLALLDNLSDPASVWWPAFLKDYIAGNIFEYDPLGYWGHYDDGLHVMNNSVLIIDGPEDTLEVWVDNLPDLSAKPYYVSLQYPQIDSTAMLQVTLDIDPALESDISMAVYAYTRDPDTQMRTIVPFEETGNQQTIKKLRDLMNMGCEAIVPVVFNSSYTEPTFTGTSLVSVIVEVIKQHLTYNQCSIGFKFNSLLVTNGEYNTWQFSKIWHGVGGVFVGKDFIAGLDPQIHYNETGSIKITIDPKTLAITGFAVDTERHDGTLFEHWAVESNGIINVPTTWVSPWEDAQDNELVGPTVCNMISVEMVWQVPNTYQTIESINCDETSEIKISLEDTNTK